MKNFILKGNIYYSTSKDNIEMIENGYLICENGKSVGAFNLIPSQYSNFKLIDYTNHAIIPGLIDLHAHAPQYAFRGLGMDMELLDWLNTNAFPEESKFINLDYARKAYSYFVNDLKNSATTRACIFATLHTDATILLMQELEKTNLITYVGKVNMDRNSPDYLIEKDSYTSANETIRFIEATKNFACTKPIITPRFIPTCTDELMHKLKEIQVEYNLPMQSHLSENFGEIAWVQELCPSSKFYGDAYNNFGLFGDDVLTIMAHCVHSNDEEIALMKQNNVFVAHCPQSNTNLSSGIAPVRKYLDNNLKVGLGSDIAGGSALSIFRAMVDAIQASKLRWRLVDDTQKPLTAKEAFYLATKGGGEFFGKVGSFEAGYEFDAVVIDDNAIKHPQELDLMQRLERVLYLSDDSHIVDKFVCGVQINLD